MAGDDTFDVGASSDPAKSYKSLKNIETYIQKSYKCPDDIVKTLQKLARPTLNYSVKPKVAGTISLWNESSSTQKHQQIKLVSKEQLSSHQNYEILTTE